MDLENGYTTNCLQMQKTPPTVAYRETRIQEPRIFEIRLNSFLYFRVVFHNSG